MKPKRLNIQPKLAEVGREHHQCAEIRVGMLLDDVLALQHLLRDSKFDLAAHRLLMLYNNYQILAARVAHLVEPLPECKLPK